MGQDLAKKAAPAFRKGWDRELAALKTPDLLSQKMEPPKLILQVQLQNDTAVVEGQAVQLNCQATPPRLVCDLVTVGSVIDPPAQLGAAIVAGGMYLQAEVTAFHVEAGIAEVVLK